MSDKKKILLLTDWYEPGYKAGGPIQSCRNFVSALHDVFDLSIITSDRDAGDTQPYPGIATDTWIERDPGFRIWYGSPAMLRSDKMRRLIASAAADYIYLNSMYSLRFTILPLWWKKRGQITGDIVIAPRGMLQEGAMGFKAKKKKLFIAFLNAARVPRRLTFQATDEQEKKDILRYFPSAGKVRVVANFARTDRVEWKPVSKRPGELDCVLISRMAPKKNLLFLLNALRSLPGYLNLRLNLYGEIEDTRYWEKCLSAMDNLPPTVSVKWLGPIPNERVTEVLQEHHVFVLPTLGENFGHAIFEALLAGKPVLISDRTPWSGLEAMQVGYDLPFDAALFIQALVKIGTFDQTTYDRWSMSAFEYAGKVRPSESLKEEYLKLFS